MRHDFLDRYSRLSSPLHRLPASSKMAAALIVVIAVALVPPGAVLFFAGAGLVLILAAAISTIPPLFLLKRLLFLEPFVLGIAFLSLLRPGGVQVFGGILLKSTVSLFALILLSNSTPFAEILKVLQRVRVPGILITILALMYRYLFVLIDEAERMHRARMSRSVDLSRSAAWRSFAALIGQLFVRSTERAERIYAAMVARGWE